MLGAKLIDVYVHLRFAAMTSFLHISFVRHIKKCVLCRSVSSLRKILCKNV